MATNYQIKRRQNIIKSFIIECGAKPPTLQEIMTKINNDKIFFDISETTIKRDLRDLKVKCDKKTSTYILITTKNISILEKKICTLLRKCTLFKPVAISSPIILTTGSSVIDTNPDLNLFSLLITSEKDFSIDELSTIILKLYNIYCSDNQINDLYTHQCSNYIQYIFTDKNNLLNFYNNLVRIQSLKF